MSKTAVRQAIALDLLKTARARFPEDHPLIQAAKRLARSGGFMDRRRVILEVNKLPAEHQAWLAGEMKRIADRWERREAAITDLTQYLADERRHEAGGDD